MKSIEQLVNRLETEYKPKPFPNDLKNSEATDVFTLAYDMETALDRAIDGSDERFFELWKEYLSRIGNSVLSNETLLNYDEGMFVIDGEEYSGSLVVSRMDSTVRQAAQFYTRQVLNNGANNCTLQGYREKFRDCVRLMLTEPFYTLIYDLIGYSEMKNPFTFRDVLPFNRAKQAWRSLIYPNIGEIKCDSFDQDFVQIGDARVKERQKELGDIYRVLFEDLATILYEEKCYGIALEHAAILSAAYPQSKTFNTLFSHSVDKEGVGIQGDDISTFAYHICRVNYDDFEFLNYGSFVQNVLNVLNHRYGDSIKIPNVETDPRMLVYQYNVMKSLDQMEHDKRDSASAALKPLIEATLEECKACTYEGEKKKVLDESTKQIAIVLSELADSIITEETEDLTF